MQIIGESIPYKRLGFNQLEEFLKSVPEISVKRKGGEVYIEAKESQTSSHVTKLVSKQKRSGKKKPKTGRNGPPRQFRTAPRFAKRIYKAPLLSTPAPQHPQHSLKQCYMRPLLVKVPQNNNISYNNTRVVSEVNKASYKPYVITSSNSMPVHQSYGGIMEKPSLVSQFSPKNMKHTPPSSNGKVFLTMSSDGSLKPDMTFRNDPSLSPSSNNLNSFKESIYNGPADQPSYSSTPTPPEEPVKKIKQLAQDRLDKVRRNNKLLVSVSVQHGENTSPYQRQLSAYIQERNWEEAVYKILKENSGKRVSYCTVSILIPRMAPNLAPEAVDCGTFPNDFYDVNEAKECVAKQALEKLKKREIFNTYPIIQDPSLIIQRVEGMVKEKDTGKWASRIEDEHRSLFKEILPPHWLDVVHASDQFIVEELANSSLLIKAKENAVPFPIPVDSTIPKLILPEINTWDVFVTRAASVTEVCVRFIGDDYSVRLFFLSFYFF
ncbi:tudor domain-containing protein 7 isoform X2 [Halyomorpha halys]